MAQVMTVSVVTDITMQCFEDVMGDTISKESFVCILALFYELVAL